MPLLSEEHISALFPEAEVVSTRRTFQNCLVEIRLPSRDRAVIKAYDTADHYQVEKYWLEKLADKKLKFRVPQLLQADDNRQVLLLSFLAGETLSISALSQSVWSPFMEALRDFHRHPVPPLGNNDLRKTLAMYEANFTKAKHLTRGECHTALDAVARIRKTIDTVKIDRQLIHGDLNAGNVLHDASAEGFPFALLDFERTGVGDAYSDLAKFIWRVFHSDPLAASELLASYLGRQPEQAEHDKLKFFCAIEYLGAISYYEYRGHQEGYPFKDDAVAKLSVCL